MDTKKLEEEIKSEDWGRFIENRSYFRKMPEEDYQSLKVFVETAITKARKEGILQEKNNTQATLDILTQYTRGLPIHELLKENWIKFITKFLKPELLTQKEK